MSRNQPPGFKTREIHAGVSPDPVTGAILTPIYQSTTFVQESVDQYLPKGTVHPVWEPNRGCAGKSHHSP